MAWRSEDKKKSVDARVKKKNVRHADILAFMLCDSLSEKSRMDLPFCQRAVRYQSDKNHTENSL